jgi:hypothetical protein
MYGDAPVTVSVSIVTNALDEFPGVVKLRGKFGRRYVKTVISVSLILWTFVEIL